MNQNEKPSVMALETSDTAEFHKECEALVSQGYRLSSSACGFVDSPDYNFCSSWQAVFVLPEAAIGGAK